MEFFLSVFSKLYNTRSVLKSESVQRVRECRYILSAIQRTSVCGWIGLASRNWLQRPMEILNAGKTYRHVQTQHDVDSDYDEDHSSALSPPSPICVWILDENGVSLLYTCCCYSV